MIGKETRRRISDVVAGVLTVALIAGALWLVRCSSRPQPVYYSQDSIIVITDTIPDSISRLQRDKKKKSRQAPTPRRPKQRHHLDEPVRSE